MAKRYSAIFSAFNGSVWAILPEKMDAILGFLGPKFFGSGMMADAETVEKVAASNRQESRATVNSSVAVLPVYGVISQRMDMLSDFSGGTSTDRLGKEFDALVADSSVGSIVLDIDSPGGSYYGTPELARKIFDARGTKPIIAVANSLAASAAYWIGSAADEIVVTPSGDVGSVGVLAVHYDQSAFNESVGVKPTYVTYGVNKAEFNQDSPLSPESLQELQRRVDEAGESFVLAVAKHRGVSKSVVQNQFGQGRVYGAKEAVDRKMADRVDTLENTIARLSGSRKSSGSRRAVVDKKRLALHNYR